jgi:hypothetical protein
MTEQQPLPEWVNSACVVRRATTLHFNLKTEQLMGVRREKDIAYQRHLGMYIARELTKQSYPRIGVIFNRDHTSVLHGVRRIKDLVRQNNKRVLADLDAVYAIVCLLRPSLPTSKGSAMSQKSRQPIESAPKDGSEITVRMLEWEARVYWDDELKTGLRRGRQILSSSTIRRNGTSNDH